MFMEASFIIAKRQKQFKFSSVEEPLDKICYSHVMEYYSTITKQWGSYTCSSVDEPRKHVPQGSQAARCHVLYHFIHMRCSAEASSQRQKLVVACDWGKEQGAMVGAGCVCTCVCVSLGGLNLVSSYRKLHLCCRMPRWAHESPPPFPSPHFLIQETFGIFVLYEDLFKPLLGKIDL